MKPYEKQNHYELLELSVAATQGEVRGAYERLVRLYAPDSMALYGLAEPGEAERLRGKIVEAYEVLSDVRRRDEYNRSLGLPQVAGDESSQGQQLSWGDLLDAADHAPRLRSAQEGGSASGSGDIEAGPVVETATAAGESAAPKLEAPSGEGVGNVAVPAPVVGTGERDVEAPSSAPAVRVGEAPRLAEEAAIGLAEAQMAGVAVRTKDLRAERSRVFEVPADAEINGEVLRKVRESRSLTLAAIAERTRIPVRHLQNVEADLYEDLPAPVYLRGILCSLARELGLDAQRVSKSYLGLLSAVERRPP